MSLFSPNSRTFGLEIGNDYLRAMQLRQSYFGTGIDSVSEIAFEQSPWLKNGLKNKNKLADTIRQAISSAKPHPISLNQVRVSIPESTVFSKTISLPKLSQKELIQAIPYEAAEFLPLQLEDMYLDWRIEPTNALSRISEIKVLLVAAPKQLIDELIDTLNNADLQTVSIESEPFPLVRSLDRYLDREKVRAVLNISQKSSNCILLNQQSIKLTTTIDLGVKQLQVSPRDSIRTLSDELSSAIAYYHNRLGESDKINKLILTGAGALTDRTASSLAKISGLEVVIGYPALQLPHKGLIHPRFNTAIGLASANS